jgi:hypothetical protein
LIEREARDTNLKDGGCYENRGSHKPGAAGTRSWKTPGRTVPGVFRECSPPETLILDFWPPELTENGLFEATGLWLFVKAVSGS